MLYRISIDSYRIIPGINPSCTVEVHNYCFISCLTKLKCLKKIKYAVTNIYVWRTQFISKLFTCSNECPVTEKNPQKISYKGPKITDLLAGATIKYESKISSVCYIPEFSSHSWECMTTVLKPHCSIPLLIIRKYQVLFHERHCYRDIYSL